MQQFEQSYGQVHFRSDENIPPPATMICSSYDVETTYGRKISMCWAGYKVPLTESCDQDAPRLITHVETSRAGNGDVDVTPVIHHALKKKDLLRREHLTDTNYAEAKQFVQSRCDYGIDLIAPTRADHKWQAQEQRGFDAARFQIDWEAQKMTCPARRESSSWTPAVDRRDNQVIKVKFSVTDCRCCPVKTQCTTASRRAISIRTKEHHRRYKPSERGRRAAHFGKNIVPDQELRPQSLKVCEHLACVGLAIAE